MNDALLSLALIAGTVMALVGASRLARYMTTWHRIRTSWAKSDRKGKAEPPEL